MSLVFRYVLIIIVSLDIEENSLVPIFILRRKTKKRKSITYYAIQNCKRRIWKTDRSQIKPVKYTYVQTTHDFFVHIKTQGNFSPDKLSFFWLMKVNKFPFRLESVNTQADLSLNLAALFVHVLADVNNENTLCSHLYIFGSRASFYFCCSAQKSTCALHQLIKT